MITRATILKVGAFVALTVLLVLYVGARFLGLFSFIGARDYTVRMPISDASGLYTRGEVTFRGVKVGSIGPIEVNERGAVVNLVLAGGGPKVPADLRAVVADRSAVGERYVDLRPNSDNMPYLKDGDAIPADRVDMPVPVDAVLTSLEQFTASVPLNDLRSVVDELGKGFDGLGPKLQLLLDSTSSLTETAHLYLPQTLTLIRDARTVLHTQNELANPIKSFSSDLKLITAQLKDSDGDIRDLVDNAPDAAEQVSKLLDESGDGLSRTIHEGLSLSRITRDHLRGIQTILQVYPGLAAALPTVLPNDGTVHLGFALNINDPPPCEKGYEATVKRAGTDLSPFPINYRAYCREPLYSVTDVRGIKPQYPFVNGKPGKVPEWFRLFYSDGPQAGIYGDPKHGGHDQDEHAPVSGPLPALPLFGTPAAESVPAPR